MKKKLKLDYQLISKAEKYAYGRGHYAGSWIMLYQVSAKTGNLINFKLAEVNLRNFVLKAAMRDLRR